MNVIIEKKELLDGLEAAKTVLHPELSGASLKVAKILKKFEDGGYLSKSLIFKDLDFKSDADAIEEMGKAAKALADAIPDLIIKIMDNYPDKIPMETNNPNIRVGLGVTDTILGYTEAMYDIINYIIDRYANPTVKSFEGKYQDIVNDYKIVARVLRKGYIDYVKDVINSIGELPVVNTPDVPMSILSAVLEKKLNMSSKAISFITDIFNRFKGKGFIGNPIYHIRKFLVDLEVNKYEKLKDEKRLVELKPQKLKLEQANKNDPNLDKQIKYYEDKLEKIELRIETILGE